MLYSGRAVGSFFTESGGGTNYLCMPNEPEYTLPFKVGIQGNSTLYGMEYQYPLKEEIAETFYHNVAGASTTLAHLGEIIC